MGRFCNGLLTCFRVVQYLFSIAALACGAYITYEMYSMSASAHVLQNSIVSLNNNPLDDITADVENSLELLLKDLVPGLQLIEGTPIRAIVVAAVGLWSLAVITYLFFAHRSKNHEATNKRSIRVLLELITLLAWIASIVCSILLALEFGVFALGGLELKGAAKTSADILEPVIEAAASMNDKSNAVLNIVETLSTLGVLSVVSVIASSFCGIISFVSLIVACCTSGKKRGDANASMIADPESMSYVGKTSPVISVSESVPYYQLVPAMPPTRY